MTSLWQKIQTLEGRSLVTTKTRVPFTIVEVTDETVKLEVGPRRSSRTIPRGHFEKALAEGLVAPNVTPKELNEAEIAQGRTAYAAAIIQKTFQI